MKIALAVIVSVLILWAVELTVVVVYQAYEISKLTDAWYTIQEKVDKLGTGEQMNNKSGAKI